jgi:hypothetical protein
MNILCRPLRKIDEINLKRLDPADNLNGLVRETLWHVELHQACFFALYHV